MPGLYKTTGHRDVFFCGVVARFKVNLGIYSCDYLGNMPNASLFLLFG